VGTMSSYGLRVNIGTMMSIAHGGYGTWARWEMANTRALATVQSGDLREDTMKFYGSMHTGKNDLTRSTAHSDQFFGRHSIGNFARGHYELLWTACEHW
jgi:hypothetical protein